MSTGAILNQLGGGGSVPSGVIVMWSGETTNIPSGWFLCDGQNGTPDLRNRFIVGAGSSYGVGDTGGEATHTLGVAEMPRHGHNINTTSNFTLTLDYAGYEGYHPPYIRSGGSGSDPYPVSGEVVINATTNNTGSSQPHNNLPPYYALAYIMKA